jgi:phage FluMu protein Com
VARLSKELRITPADLIASLLEIECPSCKTVAVIAPAERLVDKTAVCVFCHKALVSSGLAAWLASLLGYQKDIKMAFHVQVE